MTVDCYRQSFFPILKAIQSVASIYSECLRSSLTVTCPKDYCVDPNLTKLGLHSEVDLIGGPDPPTVHFCGLIFDWVMEEEQRLWGMDRDVMYIGVYGLLQIVLEQVCWRAQIRPEVSFSGIRSLKKIWHGPQADYYGACIEHLLFNYLTLRRLKTLGRSFFQSLDSLLRADIRALHSLINRLSWVKSASVSGL